MTFNHVFKSCLYSMLIVFTGMIFGCSGGGGGADIEDADGGGDGAAALDVSGTWSITDTSGDNTCGELVGLQYHYELTVTQEGTALTVITPDGTFTGTLDGNKISWTGSYPEQGGTTTITSMDLTIAADGNSFSGASNWSWTDGDFSCSGTSTTTGSKQSELPPPTASLDVSGTWSVTDTSGNNTCGEPVGSQYSYEITVTQVGLALTVTTPTGTFTGTLDGNKLSWTGSYPEEGGTTTITSMDITVAADENSFSGASNWSWTDGDSSCSGTSTTTGSKQSELQQPTASLDVSGTWSVTDTSGNNTCGEPVGSQYSYVITVTQVGASVTISTPDGTLAGTLDGNRISLTGSYPEDGGMTTVTSMDLTVAADENSYSGATSWSWTDGGFSCSGGSTTTGTKL